MGIGQMTETNTLHRKVRFRVNTIRQQIENVRLRIEADRRAHMISSVIAAEEKLSRLQKELAYELGKK